MEETWGAVDDLITQGKVRYLGVSNYTTDRIEEAVDALNRVRKDSSRKIIAVQNHYNLLDRDKVVWAFPGNQSSVGDEQMFLKFCKEKKIGIVPFFPLASGMLTGRYRRDNLNMVQGKLIDDKELYGDKFLTDYNFRVVEMLNQFVRERGITMPQLAIAWLLSHEQVCSVPVGVTKMDHFEDNVKATNVELIRDDLETIEKILEKAKSKKRQQFILKFIIV